MDHAAATGVVERDDADDDVRTDRTADTRRMLLTGALVLAVLAIPLVVALGVVAHPRWYPLLDMAQTEIRVRDVASSHPPLIGLAGRIGRFGINSGSHPGPLSFWSLWPFYQLFGASSWALQVAGTCLNVIAMGLALWIGRRRGGTVLMLGVGLVLAVLMHGYTTELLTWPWNPYLPVLWWIVFLLAVWSIVLDDVKMIPVAVFAGSFCSQTHIPYLGLVGGLVAVTAVLLAWRAVDRRADPDARRAVRKWSLVGIGLGLLLWLPPVIDEIVHEPGNFTTIYEHFSDPPETPVGAREGLRVLLSQLDPWHLTTEAFGAHTRVGPLNGSVAAGLVLVAAAAASAYVSWRMRHRALCALHAVLGIALLLGFVSASRIFGKVWYYLLLWAWGIAALLLLAIVWTIAAVAGRRVPVERSDAVIRASRAALATLVVVFVAWTLTDAVHTNVQTPRVNASLGKVLPPTIAALDAAAARGNTGPYIVTFMPDPLGIGAEGVGMLNELLRLGYDVKAHELYTAGATRYHVIKPEDATLEIHVATGSEIDRWRTDPKFAAFEEIAYVEPRTPEEIAEFERLRAQAIDELRAAGQADLVPRVDDALMITGINDDVAEETREVLNRMLAIGLPTAVFIGPPSGEN